jgi:cathepsin L
MHILVKLKSQQPSAIALQALACPSSDKEMLFARTQVFLCACLLEVISEPDGSSLEGTSFLQKSAKVTAEVNSAMDFPSEFQSFMQKHGHRYAVGTQEYEKRMALFQRRLQEVHRLNSRPNRLWTAGINRLSDRSDTELLSLRGWRGGAAPGVHKAHGAMSGLGLLSMSGRVKPLPDQVSWAHLNITKQVRDQGGCGSCWAVASATVLEAHSEIHMPKGKSRSFSVQDLVSCTPNPDGCGGNGGCEGATAELAFDWAMHNGLAPEEEQPYQAVTGQCSRPPTELLDIQSAPYLPGSHKLLAGMQGASFGMTGWERLAENGYEPLMRALVERGPVAVSAAASDWFAYAGGVFDSCERDAVIDHAVTALGYGADASVGQKYWLIQNSWGPGWGEAGRIRLLRTDGDETESCGIDHQPEVGTACKGGPKQVKVCGQCGVLYDSVVPHFGEADAEVHHREQVM